MQSIIVISLLVLVLTFFSLPSVNSAPSKSERKAAGVTNSTTSSKTTPPAHRNTSTSLSTRSRTTHSPSTTRVSSRISTSKPTKRTPSPTSKTTTTKVAKKSDTKSKIQGSRHKRLSTWDWI